MAARVEGVSRLLSRFQSTPRRVEGEVASTLRGIGRDLKSESQSVAPFKEGDLRASWFDDVTRDANGATLEAGYDGPRDYLLVQHEGGWLNHMGRNGPVDIRNYTTPGTGPKFLERPFAANLPKYKKAVKEAMQRALR